MEAPTLLVVLSRLVEILPLVMARNRPTEETTRRTMTQQLPVEVTSRLNSLFWSHLNSIEFNLTPRRRERTPEGYIFEFGAGQKNAN